MLSLHFEFYHFQLLLFSQLFSLQKIRMLAKKKEEKIRISSWILFFLQNQPSLRFIQKQHYKDVKKKKIKSSIIPIRYTFCWCRKMRKCVFHIWDSPRAGVLEDSCETQTKVGCHFACVNFTSCLLTAK